MTQWQSYETEMFLNLILTTNPFESQMIKKQSFNFHFTFHSLKINLIVQKYRVKVVFLCSIVLLKEKGRSPQPTLPLICFHWPLMTTLMIPRHDSSSSSSSSNGSSSQSLRPDEKIDLVMHLLFLYFSGTIAKAPHNLFCAGKKHRIYVIV